MLDEELYTDLRSRTIVKIDNEGSIIGSEFIPGVEEIKDCKTQYVSDGIGDDYRIKLYDSSGYHHYRIEESAHAWYHRNPVFIWAPTGKGKNTFIYEKIVPYVRDLNYEYEIAHRVLILSNRAALRQQVQIITSRQQSSSEGNDNYEDDETIYHVDSVVDVMTYQSLLRRAPDLKKKQNGLDRYDFVICDEAHFFTSDAWFNPDTDEILNLIPEIFRDAVRVYMSATLGESIHPIIDAENRTVEEEYDKDRCGVYTALNPKTMQNEPYRLTREQYLDRCRPRPILYAFSGNYDYLNVHDYQDLSEPFLTQIVDSIEAGKKWLIFVDNKKEISLLKKQLESLLKERKCGEHKVLAANANSKQDANFQYIVKEEKLPPNVYALITTSVLDNGINIYGIDNIVTSTLDEIKCRQMVGRARVKPGDKKRKTLYLKRFSIKGVQKLQQKNNQRKEAYHAYDMAHQRASRSEFPGFFLTYFYSSKAEFGRHLFKPLIETVYKKKSSDVISCFTIDLRYNKLARKLTNNRTAFYENILNEMKAEKEETGPGEANLVGMALLARQYSWFGKDIEEDFSTSYNAPAKQALLDFLEEMASSGRIIVQDTAGSTPDNAITATNFWNQFIPLYVKVFGKFEPNNDRPEFGRDKINRRLKDNQIPFTITGPRQKPKDGTGQWKVERVDSEDDSITNTQQDPES